MYNRFLPLMFCMCTCVPLRLCDGPGITPQPTPTPHIPHIPRISPSEATSCELQLLSFGGAESRYFS